MLTKTDAYPDVAIPPGEYLAEEIAARNMTQKELARRMGRPANAINEIINGKKAVTAETALQLEEVMPEIPARRVRPTLRAPCFAAASIAGGPRWTAGD